MIIKFLACLGLFAVLQIPIICVEEAVVDTDKGKFLCLVFVFSIQLLSVFF